LNPENGFIIKEIHSDYAIHASPLLFDNCIVYGNENGDIIVYDLINYKIVWQLKAKDKVRTSPYFNKNIFITADVLYKI
jgi:hypothetical protein